MTLRRTIVAAIVAAPVTVPLLAAVVLFVGWAATGGAEPMTTWGWGALALLGVLLVCVRVIPLRWSGPPLATRIALAAMATYTVWSFASIGWADDRGAALEGADRTLLYLIVLALFAAWRQRGATAGLLLGVWVLGLAVLAAITVLRLPGADAVQNLFLGADRLADPTGYPNGAAALWLMPAWPALALATTRAVPWGVRSAFAGAVVLFADLALLSQSRGALIAVPIVLAVTFAVLPDRIRRLVTLAPIAVAIGASVPSILHATDALGKGPGTHAALTSASLAILLAVVVAAVVVAAGALLEAKRPRPPRVRMERANARRVQIGGALVLGLVVVGLIAAGSPGERLHSAWSSFKHGYSESGSGNRLTSGLGSDRYDFYRVALDVFKAHPVTGVGVDNFQQNYLALGHSTETPRYPHSVELRTLTETGVVGAALLLAALAAGLAAGLGGARSRDPMTRAAAAGALGAFAYWFVHGSADWFWEFAGLGAPAFACLGLAAALAPRPEDAAPARWPLVDRWPAGLAVGAVTLLAVLVLGAPWLAAKETARAGQVWRADPAKAYAELRAARELNPLAGNADLVAGSIAVRRGDLAGADAAFARALARNRRGSYATLERGAIASQRGDRAAALALLGRARELSPRDRLTALALRVVRGGGRVDVAKLNEAILADARELVG